MFTIRYLLVIAIISNLCKSEEECLIEECGQILQACSSSEVCSEALSQVYDVCESVEKCTDQDYVQTEICGLNDECAEQIVTIASCFIDNCSSKNVDADSEQQEFEQEAQDAAELIGQEQPQETEETLDCFESGCGTELELCHADEGCDNLLNNAEELCDGDDYRCLNEDYVQNIVCDGYDAGCKDLVLATAHCYYQNCNDECINQECHENLTNCINSENCNQGLELAYSGKCEEINCLDNDAQLNVLCNDDQVAADNFNVLANCYYDNCYNQEIEEEHNDYKGYGSAECIAESGYHAYLDEYGNCCAGLDRIDCLWNLEESQCGWFYHNGEGYCYSWQGAETCAQFKQNAIMASPLSCFFEDCFTDSCNEIIGECKNNQECAEALNKYTYQGANDYTLCGGSTECVQIFDEIISCLNDNCVNEIQEERKSSESTEESFDDTSYDSSDEFTSTEETNDNEEETYSFTQYDNDDEENISTEEPEEDTSSSSSIDSEKPKLKENKVLVKNKAIN